MGYQVKVDYSPTYELLSSFFVYATQRWTRNLDWGHQWLQTVNDRLDPEFAKEIADSKQWPFADYDVLYLWVCRRKHADNIEEHLQYLEQSDEKSLHELAIPYIDNLSLQDIVRIRNSYVPLLRKWYEQYFRELESLYCPLLEEDAAEKRMLIDKMEPEALVEYATNGVVLELADKVSTVLLIPMLHTRPINAYCYYNDLLLILYPVDMPEFDEDQPPTNLIRFTNALADEIRLRILRFLAQDIRTQEEIAAEMQLTRETTLHHIMMLRAAGLVRVHMDGEKERYSIRADGIAEMQLFLESYIRV